MKEEQLILWLDEVGLQDGALVGGKNASLGEMYQNLANIGVSVPPGFAITVHAYQEFLNHNKLQKSIDETIKDLNPDNLMDLAKRGQSIRKSILGGKFTDALSARIAQAYKQLCEQCGVEELDVAVRSSATTEDLPDASFAGQQETFLNIRGFDSLLEAIKKCFASLFTNRAICYRHDKDFEQFNIGISVAVQQMIRSDSASSGVIFTIDTETGFRDIVFMSAGYGLGEAIVQGQISPDEYLVYKPFLKDGSNNVIISKRAGSQTQKLIYTNNKDNPIDFVALTEEEGKKFVLTDQDIIELAKQSCIIEDYYSSKHGRSCPMDIEWAKDGDGVTVGTGKIYIIQARPETVQSQKDCAFIESYVLESTGSEMIRGQAIGTRISKGIVNIILTPTQIENFTDGAVLVTGMTDPDWEPIMKRASAIITDKGGRTCHAAIVSRELGIPCVIGTKDATKRFDYGRKVTVDCSQGEVGIVYNGFLPYRIERVPVKELHATKTKVMINVGNPEAAFMLGQIPNDGVGIAPMEAIINNFVGIHPYLLLNYEAYEAWMKDVQDESSTVYKKMMRHHRSNHVSTLNQIQGETKNYGKKLDYFLDQLTFGLARIASSFYPKDVMVKLIDPNATPFHATLLGGKTITLNGGSFQKEKSTFDYECKAIQRVRSEMKFRNVKILLPQLDDPELMDRCLIQLEKHNLIRGKNGLEILATWTIGSAFNESLIERFDGISLILMDELTDKSRKLMRQVFQTIKKYGCKIGFHAQALDDLKSFAPELIDLGVDSICSFPETLIPIKIAVVQKEKELNWIS